MTAWNRTSGSLCGFPNYFRIGGADTKDQTRYVVACLALMHRTASSRIEVRRSDQRVFNERVHVRQPQRRLTASAFDLSSATTRNDDVYDGAATLIVGDARHWVRVRLTGHVDPIDDQYHWQGTVFDVLPDGVLKQARTVTLTVGEHTAPARITERTPQATHSIAGAGIPLFAFGDVELAVRPL